MRYLKKHQVPFAGFSWDHPLRARWREMGHPDPAMTSHPWQYIWDSWWKGIALSFPITLLICAILARVLHLSWSQSTPSIMQSFVVVEGLTLFFTAGMIALDWKTFQTTADKDFLAAMKELAKALGLETEELPYFNGKGSLQMPAEMRLIFDARKHLKTEAKFLPGASEREVTKQVFTSHFDLFKRYGLIHETTTWDPFFREAKLN